MLELEEQGCVMENPLAEVASTKHVRHTEAPAGLGYIASTKHDGPTEAAAGLGTNGKNKACLDKLKQRPVLDMLAGMSMFGHIEAVEKVAGVGRTLFQNHVWFSGKMQPTLELNVSAGIEHVG